MSPANEWPDFDWSRKQVVVTGGAGFLGRAVVRRLTERGLAPEHVIVPRSAEHDLRRWSHVERLFGATANHGRAGLELVVIHLAAKVGGIGFNREFPGELFYDNLMMGAQTMELARQHGAVKFVAVGTVCAYPKHTEVPFREENLWSGYPEETNAPYGLAKKMLLVQAQAYREQYGFNAIFLLPVNLYGPADNFSSASAHVIPALIRKCVEAQASGASEIVVWGDGSPTREFLYVDDAAEAIVLAAERYNEPQPVNLGSASEISIRELASVVAEATGYTGTIRWDISKPNGQPRRKLDITRAERGFGFRATTPFAEGLARQVAWYREQRVAPDLQAVAGVG